MPRLPDQLMAIDVATPEKPYRLVAAPSRQFLNTSFTEMPTSRKREERPTALLHPETMAQLGLKDSDPVRLGNEKGSVLLHAKARAGQHPTTIVVESVWPNGYWEEGVGINLLTSAEPGLPGGGAVFHDTAVWLEPAADEPPVAPRREREALDA
jgi:anaerobic selenocysteine-containing dehydrogenase